MMLANGTRMNKQWTQLMETSEALLTATSQFSGDDAGVAAARLLHDANEWQRWEREFGDALRKIVIPARRMEQIRLLRIAGFNWIHDAVPFRLVRDLGMRGRDRQRVVKGLHNGAGFARAMVAEHKRYIRSSCSYACSTHIGQEIFGDPIFTASMDRYRDVYTQYFNAFCSVSFPEHEASPGSERSLLPLLKQQVTELRRAILDYPRDAGWLMRELQFRAPTGTTQRMPRLQ